MSDEVELGEYLRRLNRRMDDMAAEISSLHRAVQAPGCICPPGAQATCQGALCPRRGYPLAAGRAVGGGTSGREGSAG